MNRNELAALLLRNGVVDERDANTIRETKHAGRVVFTADVARALAHLEAELARVSAERDEAEATASIHAGEQRKLTARLARISKTVEGVLSGAEGWDCSEVWEDDGDCIDNEASERCLRCAVITDLRAAIKGGSDV